jgi:hypothetical protein
MSVITEVKNVILANLKCEVELKKSIGNFLNTLNTDLDVGGYEPSSEMDEAVEDLNATLLKLDTTETPDEKEESDLVLTKRKTAPGETGYRDSTESDEN